MTRYNLEILKDECRARGWRFREETTGWFIWSEHAMLSHVYRPTTTESSKPGDQATAGTPWPRGYGSGSFDALMDICRLVESCKQED